MVKKIILLTISAFILSGEGRCSFVTRELLSPAIRRICFSENHLAVCSAFSPQKRYLSSAHTAHNRYMSFPKAPDWMLSKPQSHSSCAAIDESWTQHYNPVDDVFYYQSRSDNAVAPSYEEAHVSNSNKMVRVRDQGTHLIKKLLPFCATGRIKSEFMPYGVNAVKYVGIGTAVAIDSLVALSVAHNFLPQSLGGSKNMAKHMAQCVSFEWQYDNPSKGLSIPIDRYKIHPRWEQSFDPEFDFAVLLLGTQIHGVENHAKPFIASSDYVKGKNITVVGYPAKVPNVQDGLQGEVMYVSSGSVISCCGMQLHYDANTYNGNSGGPVVLDVSKSDLVALHTRGDPNAMRNSGVKLRAELEEFICETLKGFYNPSSFEAEVKLLIEQQYPNLSIGEKEKSVISSLHTIDQVIQFLNFLKKE